MSERREGFLAGDLVRCKEEIRVRYSADDVERVAAGTYGVIRYFQPEDAGLHVGVRWLCVEGETCIEVFPEELELITTYEDLGKDDSVA